MFLFFHFIDVLRRIKLKSLPKAPLKIKQLTVVEHLTGLNILMWVCTHAYIHGKVNCRSSWLTTENKLASVSPIRILYILWPPIRAEVQAPVNPYLSCRLLPAHLLSQVREEKITLLKLWVIYLGKPAEVSRRCFLEVEGGKKKNPIVAIRLSVPKIVTQDRSLVSSHWARRIRTVLCDPIGKECIRSGSQVRQGSH